MPPYHCGALHFRCKLSEAIKGAPAIRARGTGSVGKVRYKDAAGNEKESPYWYIWYRVDGRLIRESTKSESKMVAEKLLQRRLGEAGLGVKPAQDFKKLKYEEIRAGMLAEYKAHGRATLVTLKDGTQTVSGLPHLDDFFAGRTVSTITTDTLREFINKRKADGAENGTVNRSLALLRHMMRLAYLEGKIRQVPRFPMLKEGEARQGFLEPEQFAQLLAAVPEKLRPLMMFLFFTGCRLGAAKKIQWSQLVFNGKHVEVRLEASQVKNRTPLTLPLPADLAKILRKQFRKDGSVFCATNLRKAFQYAAVKVGLGTWRDPSNPYEGGYEGVLLHDLRRSGVRNLIRSGVREDVAMKISGHKTRAVFARYNITDSADLHAAMEQVQEFVTSWLQVAASKTP